MNINGNVIRRVTEIDMMLAVFFNQFTAWRGVTPFFSFVSRLGDGLIWYILMLLLPIVVGAEAMVVSLRMVVIGAVGVAIYKLIKHTTSRPRPYAVDSKIHLGTAPLDQYSFPSGHTLHAVSFTMLLGYNFPPLLWFLIPFVLLIALSRVILGLHYLTDVFIGACLGLCLGLCGIIW